MPYVSNAQRRWAHTQQGVEALGGPAKVAEWDSASKGEKLPARAPKVGIKKVGVKKVGVKKVGVKKVGVKKISFESPAARMLGLKRPSALMG